MAYYTRSKAFQQDQEAWAMAKDPGLFWQMHYDDCKELYQLATRLLPTLANSVPSERSFSSVNILHSKSRNQFTVERVSKMLYIQVNRRTLGRVSKPAAQLEEEELEITDDDDDDDLILCRYSVAQNTFLCEIQG